MMRTVSAVVLTIVLPLHLVAACSGDGDGAPPLGELNSDQGDTGGGDEIAPTGCTPGVLETTGELLSRWGSTTVTIDGQEYFMQINEWNTSDPQTMAYGGDYFFKITQQEASSPTAQGPTGFPSMFIGANSGNSTSGSNLPKQVSQLTTVPTTWRWRPNEAEGGTSTSIYNVAYDLWFSTSPGGEPGSYHPSGGFLMVWLHDPPIAQPIGTVHYRAVTLPNVPGSWDVWVGDNVGAGVPCISYVARNRLTSLSCDLNEFIKDAVTYRSDTIQNDWYLTNVFIGFEIWEGGVGLETTDFCVIVN
jgi:endoglucanase